MKISMLVSASVLAISCPALAAETAGDVAESGDIVVTAQKRSERLQDVPMSVSAVEARSLVNQNLLSLKDYASRIPGLTVNAATNRTNGIAIRGVTTGGGGNPSVAVLIDDIPFGGSGYAALAPIPDIDPSDLAQVEVLRGPQGVLYGASNLGGLVKYVTKTANTNELSGRVEVGGSTVRHGEEGWQGRAALNVPVINDQVGIRVSGFYRKDPGFIDNTQTGRKDANDAKAYGGRAALHLAPTERLTFDAAFLYQKLESNELGFMELGPDYRPATSSLGAFYTGRALTHSVGTSRSNTTQRLYSLRADYDLDFATLTSLTGYGQSRFNQQQDTTARFDSLLQLFGFPAATPSALTDRSRTNKFSQELRLASATGGTVEWLIGAFYTREKSQLDQLVDALPTAGPNTNLYTVVGPNNYKEYAGFANLTYRFSPQFDVQIGGRYAHNKQSVRSVADGPLNGGLSNNFADSSEGAFTWLVTPRYRFDQNNMIYARVATGYRPGGPNTDVPGIPLRFDSDTTITYEAGIKGSLADRRFSYDLAAYWIDWKDIQLQLTAPNQFQYFDNAGKARSRGIEGTLTFEPWSGTVLNGNFNWGKAELRDGLPAGGNYGLAGDRLPFSPKFSSNLAVDQNWDVGELLVTAGATLSYVGERKGAFAFTAAVPRMILRDYTTLDLRAGLRTADRWAINLFVRNALDSRGWTSGQLRSAPSAAQGYQVYVVQPRTFGINLSKEF